MSTKNTDKITPGPWTLFDLDEENPGCRWSIVKGGPLAYLHTEPCDQGQANARLIAAAPDLLEAAELCIALCKEIGATETNAYAQARAALAKATGGT